MPIKAVIFDYGGVLIHMVDETPRQQLAERWHVPLEEIYSLVFKGPTALPASRGELTTAQHWSYVLTNLHIPPAERPLFIRQFWSADDLNGEVVTFIRSLRPRYKVALLSNAFDDLRQELKERWQVTDIFDDIVISAEVGVAKPSPHIYRLALSRLGVQPSEAVFVDDMPENVAGARAVGMQAIQFQDFRQMKQELRKLQVHSDHTLPPHSPNKD